MAMKMTHISKTLLSIVCTLWGMSACSDDYNKYDDCPACNYYPVAVGNSTGTPVHAIGVEMVHTSSHKTSPAMMVQRLKIGKI